MSDDQSWQKIISAYEHRQTLTGVITAIAHGGVTVDLGVPAFLPDEQIDLSPPSALDLQEWIGRSIEVEIVRYQRAIGDLVVSRRAILERQRDASKAHTLPRVRVGAILPGKIKLIAPFGAFVDLGGITGTIHVNDLPPDAQLSVGQEVDVEVIKYVPETERIGLRLA